MQLVKRLFLGLIAILLAGPAFAGFDDGMAAFNRGDFKSAYDEWRPLAEKGDARAQGRLGQLYIAGLGVERNVSSAVIWFEKSALQNDPVGQFRLGALYAAGVGVREDPDLGLELIQKAAAQNLPAALSALGFKIKIGYGLPKNEQQGQSLINKAMQEFIEMAQQGDIEAQAQVASLYMRSPPPSPLPDAKLVTSWITNAAERGLPAAQLTLGVCYLEGKLFPQNMELAFQWFEKAAIAGNDSAQVFVANSYEKGLGVPQNKEKAVEWYLKAAKLGNKVAEFKFRELSQK